MPDIKAIKMKPEHEKPVLKVAAYCRVSSDSDDQLNSFATQITYYTDMFRDSKDILVNIYADEGISGTSLKNRDDFLRMVADCRQGKINRILSKSISRFARNTKECLQIIRELKIIGVSVHFEKENIDTAEIDSEMLLTIMSAVAQQESQSISNNVRWGVRHKMKAGTFIPSSVPFGYRLINNRFEICEPEAEIVKEVFALYLKGLGVFSIADIINSRFSDFKLSKNGIRYMLSNERYIGDSLWQKTYTTDTFPYIKKINTGESDMYYAENTHAPIIDKETFIRAKELLTTRRPNDYSINTYPLSKKIFCGNCGSVFRRKPQNRVTSWVCRNHDSNASCSAKRINEQLIYTAFVSLFNKLKQNYKYILIPLLKQLQMLESRDKEQNEELSAIQQEILSLKEQNYLLTKLKSQNMLDDIMFNEQFITINKKIGELKKELLQYNVQKSTGAEDISRLIDYLKDNDFLKEFNNDLFNEIIIKITAKADKSLIFHIIGGLEPREEIHE